MIVKQNVYLCNAKYLDTKYPNVNVNIYLNEYDHFFIYIVNILAKT